jgi:hypothetical protein
VDQGKKEDRCIFRKNKSVPILLFIPWYITGPGQISDPIDLPSGIYIFARLSTSLASAIYLA